MSNRCIIAIDGPAGAGKTTLSKELSDYFKINLVNTGKFYRAIAVALEEKGLGAESAKYIIKNLDIAARWINKSNQIMLLNGNVVEDSKLTTEKISKMASDLSAQREVREWLLDKQRESVKNEKAILEGRDIGTVVFPDAELKIYLTANPLIRAYRRYKDLAIKDTNTTPEAVFNDLITRDYNDSHREYAPLKVAEGAIIVDTSEMGYREAYYTLIGIIDSRVGSLL